MSSQAQQELEGHESDKVARGAVTQPERTDTRRVVNAPTAQHPASAAKASREGRDYSKPRSTDALAKNSEEQVAIASSWARRFVVNIVFPWVASWANDVML